MEELFGLKAEDILSGLLVGFRELFGLRAEDDLIDPWSAYLVKLGASYLTRSSLLALLI